MRTLNQLKKLCKNNHSCYHKMYVNWITRSQKKQQNQLHSTVMHRILGFVSEKIISII